MSELKEIHTLNHLIKTVVLIQYGMTELWVDIHFKKRYF